MAKEIAGLIKLQIKGGAANPSPPVGPALGSKGVNIMQFCKQFNARTADLAGKVLPVIITVYADKSFDFIIKQPPVAIQLLDASKAKKGSAEPHVKKVGISNLGTGTGKLLKTKFLTSIALLWMQLCAW
jgi:large subunit ribosomal protein L11